MNRSRRNRSKTRKILPFLAAAAAMAVASMGASSARAAVTEIDLLASGTQTYSNNSTSTTFSLSAQQPAGSGVFGPFVRIQGSGNSEQGYNTSDTKDTLDDTSNGPANPLIPFNTVVDKNGNINLTLDYNEPGSEPTSQIDLLNLVLVVSTNPNKSGPADTSPTWTVEPIPSDPGDVTLYTMDATTDNGTGNQFLIHMDADDNLASGNGGSGQADLTVQIQVGDEGINSLFDGNHYLYVYSLFGGLEAGGPVDGATSAGYEEWAISTPSAGNGYNTGGGIPEPASLGLLAIGGLGLLLRRRRSA